MEEGMKFDASSNASLLSRDNHVQLTKNRVTQICLAGPVLRAGTASASFQITYSGELQRAAYVFALGLFPADMPLGSDGPPGDHCRGKFCGLWIDSSAGGSCATK